MLVLFMCVFHGNMYVKRALNGSKFALAKGRPTHKHARLEAKPTVVPPFDKVQHKVVCVCVPAYLITVFGTRVTREEFIVSGMCVPFIGSGPPYYPYM